MIFSDYNSGLHSRLHIVFGNKALERSRVSSLCYLLTTFAVVVDWTYCNYTIDTIQSLLLSKSSIKKIRSFKYPPETFVLLLLI
jgi:hypothetical protein